MGGTRKLGTKKKVDLMMKVVKPKGIVHFLRKVEGKPQWTPPKVKKVYQWPGSCAPESLYRLVVDVVENCSPGGNYFNSGLVNDAFTWDTHELEDHWFQMFDGFITEEAYECCRQWYQAMVNENRWPYQENVNTYNETGWDDCEEYLNEFIEVGS